MRGVGGRDNEIQSSLCDRLMAYQMPNTIILRDRFLHPGKVTMVGTIVSFIMMIVR